MTDEQINALREAVASLPIVLWHDPNGAMRFVKSVPTEPRDPDGTGYPEMVAILEGGQHIDLPNVDPEDFLCAAKLFPATPSA
ncbi:hypothetical protein Sp245p_26400 (plasmid) [Azospirillum baldaniorum]|uniref:Uncharacterized protein n=1 Tax=Azospirillum baldaniorum TaxID=1064539 RepID=A0A9P1JZW4_9PROT|nr:hypothetical protein [Azospirillum baldaniorum]AWJ93257.1 hypothetical protein Sp245p_25885 [Azospirillum baldaniorum]AWJ93355.1 hypothetical protein Sp245p_26400 [Azospirillum baldaniorum]TWA77951.1 hypothetical protein FBZ85_106111 [Azospirillum brasilense]CCD02949.1 protein of unknown function [Azospirillum baldaniorum]